jgi:hypothetical protein
MNEKEKEGRSCCRLTCLPAIPVVTELSIAFFGPEHLTKSVGIKGCRSFVASNKLAVLGRAKGIQCV